MLTSSWLPCTRLPLLYRGSRDGMTPADFHALCDDQGSTLTLIRAQGTGCVFGGYSNVPWRTYDYTGWGTGSGTFLFSVWGPARLARFPLRPHAAAHAVQMKDDRGPTFGRGDLVLDSNTGPGGLFGQPNTRCSVGSVYATPNPDGEPVYLAGPTDWFEPEEVEVFAVRHD